MQIKLAGDAYVLKSSITKTQYETLKKYRPTALSIKDEDGNDVFTVGYEAGKPSIASFAVTFSNADTEGNLTATQIVPTGTNDVKGYVADVLSGVIAYLKKLEENVPAAYDEVVAERNSLIESIVEA